MPNPMDAVTNLLGGFVDKFEPAIRQHVERNVDETKAVLVQRLPLALQEVLNPSRTGERSLDLGLGEVIMNKVQSKFGDVLGNIQEKLQEVSKEQVNRASAGTVDFLTQAIVKESKDCVTSKVGGLLAHQKKKSEEGSRGVSLDFINQGRQTAIARAMEQIEPKVHQSGLEIYNKLVSNMPEAIQQLLTPGNSGEVNRGILDGGLRKILDRVREVVQQVVGSIMPTFEKSILQNIQRELENKVPDKNLVLGFVQKFASKIELGKFGNLGTLLGGILGAGAVSGAAAINNDESMEGSQGQPNNNSGYSQGTGSQGYDQPTIQGDHNQMNSNHNYNSMSSVGNYNQPATQDEYSRPSGQGNYGLLNQSIYSKPQSQGNFNQPVNPIDYNQSSNENNYNYQQSQNTYNQPQSQGSYNQPISQGVYNPLPGQGSYNQQQGGGDYNLPYSQENLGYPVNQGNYELAGKYNSLGEFQSSSREISSIPPDSLPSQPNYQPGGFVGLPATPSLEGFQQQQSKREDEIFPGGFYLPQQ